MSKKASCPICRACKTVVKVGAVTTGALFTVYMLNLDQKLLAWAYSRVNEMFDRKDVDVMF
ncbi:MAG: hypothetical protein GX083_03915 [Clostridiales bacterium]|nr:hypothetical protein [Clostridiales bacterium]